MKQGEGKRIVLADDHDMFRQGLAGIVERAGYHVVGEAKDGHEAMRLVRRLQPTLAILDFSMPTLNGIEVARDINKRTSHTQVILLTMYNEDSYVVEALSAGIRGYVLKSQVAEDFLVALREVQRGNVYLSPGISSTALTAFTEQPAPRDKELSDRERQVLHLIAEGHTTKSIADMLCISVKTAESHRSRIMARLDLHNVAGLVRYAIRRGIVRL